MTRGCCAGGAAYSDRDSADGGGDCAGVRDPLCVSGQCLNVNFLVKHN